MDIKDILKSKRIELGLTMKQLADKVGVSEGTISRWESGDIENMRRDKVAALSRALGLVPAVIMGWEDTPSSAPSLSASESALLSTYRLLNDTGQKKVRGYAEDLADNDRYTLEDKPHLLPIAAHDDGATPEQINEDKELLQ